MILTIDIGNTNIKTGLFDGAKLVNSWRMSTSKERTADEMGIMMESFFYHIGHKPREVEGIIVSSVSPSINYTVEHMCSLYFDLKPLFVGPGIKTGMNVRYDDPRALGADRICNSRGLLPAVWRPPDQRGLRHGPPPSTRLRPTGTSSAASSARASKFRPRPWWRRRPSCPRWSWSNPRTFCAKIPFRPCRPVSFTAISAR